MSFHFACRQPPVKWSYIKSCLRFCVTGVGPMCFPICKRYWFLAPPSRTVATCNVFGVPIHHVEPLKTFSLDGLKCPVLLMVRNSLLHVWDTNVEELTEQKSLGCGTAHQLLPRSPTSEIHRLSWKLLSHAPWGSGGVVLRAPGYGGDVIRGGC
jgi:hypothetical protein